MLSRPHRRRESLFNYLFLFGLVLCLVGAKPTKAQDSSRAFPCKETLSFYENHGFVVKKIGIEHLVRILPKSDVLQDGLNSAINKLPPENQLKSGQPFIVANLSHLQIALRDELEPLLSGQTGFQYISYRLKTCNPDETPPTLEVVFVVVTTAKAAYLSNSFEVAERDDKESVETGNDKISEQPLTQKFYFGYNRSLGVYAGAKSTYAINRGPVDKLNLDVTASGSSTIINTSVSGEKEFDKGALSFAEWRLGYRYSNVPTDVVRLEDATAVGQFFAATKPLGSRNLFFRFGASVEGGNRHTDLQPANIPPTALTDAGHKALKLYVGGTFSGSYYDWKSSYGIQLGNAGRGLRVDYVKQVFDTAVRVRFLPADYRPFQMDLQFTAGSINASSSGEIPIGERFFGGNVAREFIEGDTWRITSSPLIRSFPQNRLHRLDPNSPPIGGTNFASFNITVAQTIWNRQLVPTEIARSADVVAGIGGQLLSTRLFLREEQVQASQEIKNLESTIHQLTPAIDGLKSDLAVIKSNEPNLPEDVLSTIDSSITTIEEAVAAAVLVPPERPAVISNTEELAGFINNPVEFNGVQLVRDFDEDNPSLVNALKNSLNELRLSVSQAEKDRIDAALKKLNAGSSAIADSLLKVEKLRTYESPAIETAIKALTKGVAPSGRNLQTILTAISSNLKILVAPIKAEIESLPSDSDDLAIKERRVKLNELRELIENAQSYAEKSLAALTSADEFFQAKQLPDAKFDIERLVVGFGKGLRALIVGLSDSVDDLEKPLAERNQQAAWQDLRKDADETLGIRKNAVAEFRKLRPPTAEKEANKTVSYVGRVFGVLTRELNIIGISPVMMFDVTRFGTGEPLNRTGFRYGVGGGLRLSLVNLDFTAGYSFNPRRAAGDPSGAFVFKMEVNDLFR